MLVMCEYLIQSDKTLQESATSSSLRFVMKHEKKKVVFFCEVPPPTGASAGVFWLLCLISRLTGTGLSPSGSPKQHTQCPA